MVSSMQMYHWVPTLFVGGVLYQIVSAGQLGTVLKDQNRGIFDPRHEVVISLARAELVKSSPGESRDTLTKVNGFDFNALIKALPRVWEHVLGWSNMNISCSTVRLDPEFVSIAKEYAEEVSNRIYCMCFLFYLEATKNIVVEINGLACSGQELLHRSRHVQLKSPVPRQDDVVCSHSGCAPRG